MEDPTLSPGSPAGHHRGRHDPITSIQILPRIRARRDLPARTAAAAAQGPGLVLVFWPYRADGADRACGPIVLDVPPQDVITRDNVSVKVNAVVYFRVIDPRKAVVQVENYLYATSQLAQTTLRSVLGQAELDDLLSRARQAEPAAAADHRPAHRAVGDQGVGGRGEARRSAAGHAARDGQAGRGRAREARQDHPRRGRAQAAEKLAQAAAIIDREPVSHQLRYLQTLTEIAVGEEHDHRLPAADGDPADGLERQAGADGHAL